MARGVRRPALRQAARGRVRRRARGDGAPRRGQPPPRAAVARERDPEDPHGDESRAGKQHSDRLFAAWLVETFALAPAALDDGSNAEAARAAGDEPRGTENRVTTHEDANELGAEFDASASSPASHRETRGRELVRRARVADIAGGGALRWSCTCATGASASWDPAFVALAAAARRGATPKARRAQRRARRRVARSRAELGAGRRAGAARAQGRARAPRAVTDAARRDPEADPEDASSEDASSEDASSEDASVARFEHFASEFWGDLDGELGAAIRACDVLVGMHPDQATEPIVDAALRLNKPFAVVPCCVFPDAFPERALDGAPVRSYAQFLDYLRAKDPGIETAYLPFQGRSRVLYKR